MSFLYVISCVIVGLTFVYFFKTDLDEGRKITIPGVLLGLALTFFPIVNMIVALIIVAQFVFSDDAKVKLFGKRNK